MKKYTLLLIALFASVLSFAQDGYTYTLSDNGNYSFTISAVSNFDTAGFQPITESYGFVIVLPDGVTATFTEYLPAGTSGTPTFIDGANVTGLDPSMADNDLYLLTTVTNAARFAAHTNGAVIPLVTLTVNGSPTTGEIRLLSNDSVLADNIGGGILDSFMQIDIIDDGSFAFQNGVVGDTGLTGTVFYDFSTLSVPEVALAQISIYPNPASDYINISTTNNIQYVEMFDILGKKVIHSESISKISVSHLQSGIYIVKVFTDKGKITKKIVIE